LVLLYIGAHHYPPAHENMEVTVYQVQAFSPHLLPCVLSSLYGRSRLIVL